MKHKVYKRIVTFILALLLPAWSTHALSMEVLFSYYGEILERHVTEIQTTDDGLVSAFHYRDAHKDTRTMDLIDRQKRLLNEFDPDTLDEKAGTVSFWVNAYNFFMIAYILENPMKNRNWISSVKDYGSWISPYRVFKRGIFTVGGEKYSLDQIEKDILLGQSFEEKGWKDARVHFAVNCASVGCPPLRDRLYTPENLDEMLDENVRMALNTPRHMRIEGDTLYLTSLFDWYERDFTEEAGSIRNFLKRYLPEKRRNEVDTVASIQYVEYNWALNQPENFPRLEGIVSEQ